MPRKLVSRPRTSARARNPRILKPEDVRRPLMNRIVTARRVGPSGHDSRKRMSAHEVPEIRLSGAWLEVVGFRKGRRYLLSIDREIETLYLQAEPVRKKTYPR